MATEVENIVDKISELKVLVAKLEPNNQRNILYRALDNVMESLRKYERALREPTMEIPPHPTPMCILHGLPITWDDPECTICKEIKEGTFDGKIGANDNYRNVPSRNDATRSTKGGS